MTLTSSEAGALFTVLTYFCAALDMSDAEHENFRDSGADIVEFLWELEPHARALLAHFASQPNDRSSS